MNWLLSLWSWLRPARALTPGQCAWCHADLITCPTCEGNWTACPTCSIGLRCPRHQRWWTA